MSNCFHLAIPAGDLNLAKKFYCDVLGCKSGNSEEGHWVDIDFWGNELTLHQSEERLPKVRHEVEMGSVLVPHFGIHLSDGAFQALKERIETAGIAYLDKPYRRFTDSKYEQETFFIEDPNGNILEMKTLVNPKILFKVD
ncbi:VOC family protein [Shewanella benthica]|uniref:VOC domain-containing protein n=1 Tax=Shewanella benthica KT99 TaxID=314608 RepID=A9CZH8_9GAMM|nr:VOC family protein [Shewanella benthica]EDQ02304.1 hypothetical protein KT99_13079 [Shewanella benthica KT99]